jgi:hypothetical protein
VHEGVQLHAGINNVFDKDPPILDTNYLGVSSPPFGNGNTYPQVYDALGRYVFVGATNTYYAIIPWFSGGGPKGRRFFLLFCTE